jgi:hypothetical protein
VITPDTAEQRSRARAVRLLEVTVALSRAASHAQVGSVIVHEAADALEAESAAAYFLRPDGRFVLAASRGVPESALAELQVLPLDAPFPLASALRDGRATWLESLDELLAAYPKLQHAQTPF